MNTHANRIGAAAVTAGLTLATVLAGAAPAAAAVTTRVHFDSVDGPDLFVNATPLREEYAGRGVHFFGPADADGGAVVDAVGGNWPMPARTGTQILAFSTSGVLSNGGTARWPETIRFDRKQDVVKLWVNQVNGGADARFKLVAKRAGNVVSTDVVTTDTADWVRLRVAAGRGISRVVLRANDPDNTWAADDLVTLRR